MARLSAADMSAALDFVGEANGFGDLDEFRDGILPGLLRLVPSDLVGYNEVDVGGGPSLVVTHPEQVPEFAGAALSRLAHQHPLISVQMNGDGRAYKISDFLSARDFHELELYEDLYRLIGAEDQIAFGLPGPMVIGIAMNRPRRDFSERDRSLLDLLRPHMARAYANLLERERSSVLTGMLEGGLDELGAAVVLVDPHGRIAAASARGMELIEAYMPHDWDTDVRDTRPGARPISIESERGSLKVTTVAPDGGLEGRLLVLEEEPAVNLDALAGLGLTPRQAEVLRALSSGLATEEVAVSLRISPNTVRKHLENIYRQLGLHTREQAVEAAREISRPAAPRGSSRPRP